MLKLREETLEAFNDSFDRVRSRDDFLDIFYERFLASSDEISAMFEGVDLARIKSMLRDALYFTMLASTGSERGISKLKELREFHKNLDIQSVHFDHWLDALLSAVEELDARYDQRVDEAWRAVLGMGLQVMKQGLV